MQDSPKKLTRAQSKAETRKALVEAAARVFADRGFEAASVDELARAAGYTVGALYAHFPGKEEVFLAVIERQVIRDRERRRKLLAGVTSTDAEIEILARELNADTPEARRSTLLFQEFWLYAARHAVNRPDIAAGFRSWQEEFVSATAARWIPAEETQDIPAAGRAALILALAEGLARQRLLYPEIATSATLANGIRLILGRRKAKPRNVARIRKT